ncbi:MAG: hypothetical protein H0X15_08190 [Acidobacteria bacterium]|jgi:hypothetical protein|nr:hypothetical protein [Acidobacteriota bacterium]MBA4122480.1 hypothetical protein [Acidobacteriota bacterium]MBA4184184.1 hypothetical protein [Acidobacteriota bacterium]
MEIDKAGHKVLLIGEGLAYSHIENGILREDAEISFYTSKQFNEIDRLRNYTLCIVDYSAFSNQEQFRELFYKQLLEAIEYGVNFCVVYFNDSVDSNRIGSQILKELKLAKPHSLGKIVHDGKTNKKEFSAYVKRWGSSAISFHDISEQATVIFNKDSIMLGFFTQLIKSKILYIPFSRNTSNKKDLKEGFESLIDSILTFIASSQIDLPIWAKETPFFSDEKSLFDKKALLQKELFDIESKIQIFDNAKSLLLQREYILENSLLDFLQNQLELKIFREEKFKEDFWLVDESEDKIAIAEIKSANKGFRRDMIFRVLDHKSENELAENFPTLLFVNCNLQAGSWKDKEKSLSKDEYDFAANHDVLVIRIEDVVRLWELKRLRKITKEEILNYLLIAKGWLYVNPKLEIEVKPR